MRNPFRYFNNSPEIIRLTVMTRSVMYPACLRSALSGGSDEVREAGPFRATSLSLQELPRVFLVADPFVHHHLPLPSQRCAATILPYASATGDVSAAFGGRYISPLASTAKAIQAWFMDEQIFN